MSRRAVGVRAPAWMLRHYRYATVPLLVLGDDPGARAAVAEEFWRVGPLRSGPFVRVDCTSEESTLAAALEDWLTVGQDGRSATRLRATERGTLFLDSVDSLSPRTQRLLLAFVDRFLAPGLDASSGAWRGRLIAGAGTGLRVAADTGGFSIALLDGLDKLRFEPGLPGQRGAA